MRYRPLTFTLLLVAGCGGKQPMIDLDQFPKALIGIEAKTEKVFAAFDSGDPKAADRPMHSILRDFNVVDRLAATAGLNEDQQADLGKATGRLMDAYGKLHAPMHKPEFPEDFEFEPLRVELVDGLEAVRAALPASFVEQMQAAKEKREAARTTEEAEAAPAEETQEAAADASPESPAAEDGAAIAAPNFRVAADRRADRVAPLCPSVMLWDNASYELAPEQVSRASDLMAGAPPGRRWVQLVPTLHARLNADLTIDAYGTMRDRTGSWTDPDNFEPATDRLADRLRDQFAAAIRQAVRRGMHVAILPHLDPAGGPIGEWRNRYDFAPTEEIGAGSYESLLIEPLATAIEAEATSDTRIDLALSGEMGRSLFDHPSEYHDLLKRLLERFQANPRTAGVRIGIALDWGNLNGDTRVDNQAAAAEFITACDFIGISCYAPVSEAPTSKDFAMATSRFTTKLIELVKIPLRRMTRLLYSEVGIGGGYPGMGMGWGGSKDDSWATKDDYPVPSAVAAAPHEGRGNPRFDPWAAGELIWLRREFHRALCDYLASDREPTIERAFLWSEGPWDPQGVASRRFRDEEIAALIDRHNRQESESNAGVLPAASAVGSSKGLVD